MIFFFLGFSATELNSSCRMPDIPEGNYEKGKKLFKQRCGQCHVADSKTNKTGPSLYGIIGRKTGDVPGFVYSAANKNKVIFLDH